MNKAWLLKAKSLQSARGRSSEQLQAQSPDVAQRNEAQTSEARRVARAGRKGSMEKGHGDSTGAASRVVRRVERRHGCDSASVHAVNAAAALESSVRV